METFTRIKNHTSILDRWQKVGVIIIGVLFLLPLVLTEYLAFLAGQYMLFGLLAMSLGLIWGYAGILSFGQAAFFGVGAYTMALSFQHITAVNPAYVGLVVTVVLTGALSFAMGWFYFRADVTDDYFVIVTLALPVIFQRLATTFSDVTGGFQGIFVGRMELTAPGITVPLADDRLYYYVILFALLGGYFLCRKLLNTHFGRVLVAIRENEERTKSLGYDTARYKTLTFTFSGILAGIAGALYASLSAFVSPTLTGFLLSTEVVIWVALGGRMILLGAVGGGIVVGGLSTALSGTFPQAYILILGIVFISVVVLFPKGIFGTLFALLAQRAKSE
jgi:urea ABC transporter permease protein UrtC